MGSTVETDRQTLQDELYLWYEDVDGPVISQTWFASQRETIYDLSGQIL